MIFFGVTSFTQGTWVCTYLIMMPINAVNLSVLNDMSSVWLRSSCIFLSSIHALPMRCLSSDIFWGILAWHVDTSVQPPLHSGRGDIPELGPKPVPPKASLFRDRFYRDEHPFTSFFLLFHTKVPALLPCPFDIICAMVKKTGCSPKKGFDHQANNKDSYTDY